MLGEATHEGGDSHSKYVTHVQQQRPESTTVSLTWHACKYKVYKLHQRYFFCDSWLLNKEPTWMHWAGVGVRRPQRVPSWWQQVSQISLCTYQRVQQPAGLHSAQCSDWTWRWGDGRSDPPPHLHPPRCSHRSAHCALCDARCGCRCHLQCWEMEPKEREVVYGQGFPKWK